MALLQNWPAATASGTLCASIAGSPTASFERSDFPCQHPQSNVDCSNQRTLALQVLPSVEQAEGNSVWYVRHCMAEMLRQLLCPQPDAAAGSTELHWMDARRGRSMGPCYSKVLEVTKAKNREVAETSQEEQGGFCSASIRPTMECQVDTNSTGESAGRQWCLARAGRAATAESHGEAQGKGDGIEPRRGGADHCRDHKQGSDVKKPKPGDQEVRSSTRTFPRSSTRAMRSSQQMECLHRGEREEVANRCGGLCLEGQSTGGQGSAGEGGHAGGTHQPREDQGAPHQAGRSFLGGRHRGAVRNRGRQHESGDIRGHPTRNCIDAEQPGLHSSQTSRRGRGRDQCCKEAQTGRIRAWICCIATFWQAGQVDRSEACSRHTADLCFQNSPEIWNHSIMQEDCFLNPWDASIRALDLSHEVGTWSSGSTWIITEGVRKGQHRRVRFSNDVELYVGHEFDIEMTRCTSSLRTPSSHHQIFQPAIRLKSIDPSDEDEDASLLAVHAAHLRDIEHADITMDPTFAREPQEVNEQDELVDHDGFRIVI